MSDMLERFGITPSDNEAPPKWVVVDGKQYLEGRNGKLWKRPFGITYHGRDNFEALSAICCGRPKLNDGEQAIHDEIIELVIGLGEQASDAQQDALDGMELGDSEWWHRKNVPDHLFESEMLAYRIAETLYEKGCRIPRPEPSGNEPV